MTASLGDQGSLARRPITADAALARRLAAWSATRFPPALVLLLLAMFLGAASVGAYSAGEQPVALGPLDILGFLAFVAYVFGLRVYDEHKDFETDCLLHPDRLTVTGVMPLRDLRHVHAVGLVLQAGTCVAYDHGVGAVTVIWLLATGWSLLMWREFFVAEWLRAHPVIYSVSHAVAMPLVILWAAAMGARGAVFGAAVWWLCGLAVTSAFALELSRKLAAPEDERPEIETYTSLFGVTPACAIGTVLALASMVTLIALVSIIVGAVAPVASLVALVLLALGATPYVRFAARPTPKWAAVPEAAAALQVLGSFVVLIAVLLIQRGFTWR